ncbi:MAG TPA: 8-oxoguanine deaminase [Gemmatimonadales bacterium]|nr:8-oxoguanine deaminase [Gemmatimonadales bacterium]
MTARAKPRSLLIRDIHLLVTMDGADRRLRGGYLYAEDGVIRRVGTEVPRGLVADRTIRAPFALALPGLVNAHHHLYQTLTRAHPAAANAKLFDWLTTLYPIWARLDEEAVHVAALVGMAELMLSGCTTTSDHHYLFPRGETKLIDAEIAAARKIGIRFVATRGSMSVGRKAGGLPPDSVVQDEDEILADSERVIRRYHESQPGAMVQVALAPCSPFSVSERLMRETAALAERHGVRLHTHLAETKDEETYCLRRFGRRPVEFLADNGWLDDRVWVAHGIHFTAAEIRRLGRAKVGVAHCPTSNMRLGSGIAPIHRLARSGCPIGLGVDGSASNDGSHLLAEARQALLLGRVARGADAVKVEEALTMATAGGAACLGRTDIGALEVGRRADVALFDLRDVGYSGAGDPLLGLLLCAPTRVHALIVDGRPVVEDGVLRTIALERVVARHGRIAARMLK